MAVAMPSAAICASARSTKMIPRPTTWSPKYTRIAGSATSAISGQSQSVNRSMGSSARARERLGQPVDDHVEQLDVVARGAVDPARELADVDHLRVVVRGDRFGGLARLVGLDEHDLDVV